ncbi:hypothetical protein ACFL50_03745 [Candidatus Latescibacterota bacterium]
MMTGKRFKDITLILLLGSIWGLSEASFGDWLYAREIPHASIYLSLIACLIFSIAKVFLNYRWTGTALGLFAMLFKLVNVPFFACHLLAIALLGTGFDIAYGLVTRLYSGKLRLPVIGMVGTYAGHVLFAVIITYVIRYEYWTAAGLPKVIDYIFVTGTVTALFAAVVMTIGTVIGQNIRVLSWPKLHPQLTTVLLLGAIAGIWILQQAM